MLIRHVTPHPDQGWQVTDSHGQCTAMYGSQQDCLARANVDLHRGGGGELVIHGRDGRVQDRRTIVPEPRRGHDR
ncbi:uncharacterized protein DUF2188 [Saccharopolyspora erythraea NRRL 2338]|uniref:Uncharacterized protein n=2 Tax=Saccharopolyspora erythraea TaxID=1836 RepID=A4FJC9_SACEN|nr:DUF2188 domain-containing protein [Saccharopolyspora erythraea]EQD85384.1 hypothetical protein N599_15240 [Saccharopolyspora erythraea D]PFG97824.1 uncharacterized protein DUF2188 [Saccharopolyspora erythraea NRRL 2338]QRK93765.1 DUF2188 domain-containing protein [Saccharopolyspora erythraea]CAM04154.1 hypothetical protein SACE_4888 [Saccharopolyspora erythraea NRRL 2338]